MSVIDIVENDALKTLISKKCTHVFYGYAHRNVSTYDNFTSTCSSAQVVHGVLEVFTLLHARDTKARREHVRIDDKLYSSWRGKKKR